MRGRTYVLLVPAAIIALAAAWLSLAELAQPRKAERTASPPETTGLRFEPPAFDLDQGVHFSGPPLEIETALVNVTGGPIQITEIPKTCGCMALALGGEGLNLPRMLEPGQRLPLRVEVGTVGRVGPQRYELIARGTDTQGRPVASPPFLIQGRLRAPFLAVPDEWNVEIAAGEAPPIIERTVVLADGWPGAGLQLPHVCSTAGGRMQFAIEPTDGPILAGGLDATRRYLLRIRYTPPEDVERFEETITITPVEEGVPPLEIPFRGCLRPEAAFEPPRLVLVPLGPGATVSRRLTYRYARPDLAELRLVAAPAGVVVEELSRGEGVITFRVEYHQAGRAGPFAENLKFEVGGDHRMVLVPVEVLPGTDGPPA